MPIMAIWNDTSYNYWDIKLHVYFIYIYIYSHDLKESSPNTFHHAQFIIIYNTKLRAFKQHNTVSRWLQTPSESKNYDG